jgi:uncharacterized protein YegJ (DUF2314 family)
MAVAVEEDWRPDLFALVSPSGKNNGESPGGLRWRRSFRCARHIQKVETSAMSLMGWLKGLLFPRRSAGSAARDEGSVEESTEGPIISLVLLLRQPRYLDATILCQSVNQAWGIDLSEAGADATEFIVGDDTPIIIQSRLGTYLVNNIPVPYIEDREQAARDAKELRVRKAVLEHQSWMSIDLLRAGEPSIDNEAAYRAIGALAAELINDDCLGAYCPETGRLSPFDDELGQRLKNDGAKAALDEPALAPVIQISAEDPRMVAAVATARERWPEFVLAFENRQPGDAYLVKGKFGEGENVEHMWISVTALEAEKIYGRLENEPVNVADLHVGDRVQIELADLSDWMVANEAGPMGGFTLAVMTRASDES